MGQNCCTSSSAEISPVSPLIDELTFNRLKDFSHNNFQKLAFNLFDVLNQESSKICTFTQKLQIVSTTTDNFLKQNRYLEKFHKLIKCQNFFSPSPDYPEILTHLIATFLQIEDIYQKRKKLAEDAISQNKTQQEQENETENRQKSQKQTQQQAENREEPSLIIVRQAQQSQPLGEQIIAPKEKDGQPSNQQDQAQQQINMPLQEGGSKLQKPQPQTSGNNQLLEENCVKVGQTQLFYSVIEFLESDPTVFAHRMNYWSNTGNRAMLGIAASLLFLLFYKFISKKQYHNMTSFFRSIKLNNVKPTQKVLADGMKQRLKNVILANHFLFENIAKEMQQYYAPSNSEFQRDSDALGYSEFDIQSIADELVDYTPIFLVPNELESLFEEVRGLTDAFGQIHIQRNLEKYFSQDKAEDISPLLLLLLHEYAHRYRIIALRKVNSQGTFNPLQFTPPSLCNEVGIYLTTCLYQNYNFALNSDLILIQKPGEEEKKVRENLALMCKGDGATEDEKDLVNEYTERSEQFMKQARQHRFVNALAMCMVNSNDLPFEKDAELSLQEPIEEQVVPPGTHWYL